MKCQWIQLAEFLGFFWLHVGVENLQQPLKYYGHWSFHGAMELVGRPKSKAESHMHGIKMTELGGGGTFTLPPDRGGPTGSI